MKSCFQEAAPPLGIYVCIGPTPDKLADPQPEHNEHSSVQLVVNVQQSNSNIDVQYMPFWINATAESLIESSLYSQQRHELRGKSLREKRTHMKKYIFTHPSVIRFDHRLHWQNGQILILDLIQCQQHSEIWESGNLGTWANCVLLQMCSISKEYLLQVLWLHCMASVHLEKKVWTCCMNIATVFAVYNLSTMPSRLSDGTTFTMKSCYRFDGYIKGLLMMTFILCL